MEPDDIPPPPPRKRVGGKRGYILSRRGKLILDPEAVITRKQVVRKQKEIGATREKINKKKREIIAITRKIGVKEEVIKRQKEAKAALLNVTKSFKGEQPVTQDTIDKLPPTIKKEVEKAEALFRPNPGPQTEFLAASEKEVLYGGARGGGKSYAMLVDPLRYCDRPKARGLLLRRTMPELRDLIHLSKQLYPQAFKGAKFKEQEKEWSFPSGARIEFGYAEHRDDAMRYQGQPYTWIGVDELAQFPSSDIWDILRGSLRSTDPDIPTFMRATANPGGPGHAWVKQMFVSAAEPGKAFNVTIDTPVGKRYVTRRFIPAKLEHNPYLMHSDEYLIMLASLPEHKRKQWLEGDWDAVEGAAFPEFDRRVHVIEPFALPKTWQRFRACDWGYSSPACVLWFATDWENDLFVYRELYIKNLIADVFAQRVLMMERDDPKPMRGIMDASVWAKRGDVGPTIPEAMAKVGVHWRPSDRSPNSRLAGKLEIHRRLAIDPIRKRPRIKIFNTCTNLINTMVGLPLDPDYLEDVDTKAEDHAYDALRYGCMSRPISPRQIEDWGKNEILSRPTLADAVFGY